MQTVLKPLAIQSRVSQIIATAFEHFARFHHKQNVIIVTTYNGCLLIIVQ